MSEVTFEPFQKVLVRITDSKKWFATFFSHYEKYYLEDKTKIATVSGFLFDLDAVLPYNDETKHLLGTTDSPTPPEPEFKFGDHVEVKNLKDSVWIKAVFLYKPERYFMAIRNSDLYPSCFTYCRHADW